MNLKRTDIFLIALLFLQFQILFEVVRSLSYSVLSGLFFTINAFGILKIVVFAAVITACLKGCLLAIDAFFATENEVLLQTKKAGYMLVLAAFLLSTLYIIVRVTAVQ